MKDISNQETHKSIPKIQKAKELKSFRDAKAMEKFETSLSNFTAFLVSWHRTLLEEKIPQLIFKSEKGMQVKNIGDPFEFFSVI
jgi:hypothetical protein